MNSAFPRLTTPVIGIITFIYPIVDIVINWAVYGHPLGSAQAAGMMLIAVATLGAYGWGRSFHYGVSPPHPDRCAGFGSQDFVKPMKSSGAARPISSSQCRRQSET